MEPFAQLKKIRGGHKKAMARMIEIMEERGGGHADLKKSNHRYQSWGG